MKLHYKHGLVCLTLSILATSPQSGWAQKTGKAQSTPLPVRVGYYARAPENCAGAMKDHMSGMFVRARDFESFDGMTEIVRVSRRSSREYELTDRSEDEAGKAHISKSTLRIINPDTFTLTDPNYADPKGPPTTTTYRFCSSKKPKDF